MILVVVMLATISILFFALDPVEGSLSDLDNIKPSSPVNPETDSQQDEAEPALQEEVESGAPNTRTYPTEDEYCKVDILNEDPKTREGYILKFGTNNDDELYGTSNRDLILALDGNDKIYGLEGGDIICGGDGSDVAYGDPYISDKLTKSQNRELPKGSADLIFGQEGKDAAYGGVGNDLIQGGVGDDYLFGDEGISHGDFNNEGNDLIDGGAGDDSCHDHASKTYLNCEYTDDAVIK